MRGLLSALLLCSALLLSGQESYTTATESQQAVLVPLSEKLDAMATTLERALSDSATDWDSLSTLLTSLSRQLTESSTSSRDLELETASTRASLKDLEISLSESTKLARRREVELWVLRGVAALSIATIIWQATR